MVIGSQCGVARHRDSFARTFRAPGTDIAIKLERLHPHTGHREIGFERHVDPVAIKREPQELQCRRAIRQ